MSITHDLLHSTRVRLPLHRARTHDLLHSTRVHLPLHYWYDWTGLEHTIYCTRHEYIYHYTTDMTEPGSNTWSTALDTSTLTIIPLIWPNQARTHDLPHSTRVHLPLHHWYDRTGLEHTIYCTRHEYTYHYTTDMTEPGSNTRSIVLDTSTLTITPLIWPNRARTHDLLHSTRVHLPLYH